MPKLSYELIQPLIAEETASGARVTVVFQCPATGTRVQSGGVMQRGFASQAKDQAVRSLWWSARNTLARSVSSALGYNFAGRMASNMVRQASIGATPTTSGYTAGEQRAAVVEAFKAVQNQFSWDPSRDSYVSSQLMADLQTDFAKLISAVPITNRWDQGVLARMLTEIACADGEVEAAEREFFMGFAGEGMPSLDELIGRPKLSAAELMETTPAAREPMLAMAMALAMSDEELEAPEAARLAEFAAGLQISQQRAAELEQMAKEYLVDALFNVIYADNVATPSEQAQVAQLGAKLGLDPTMVQRLDIRVRKRKGVV